MMEGPAAGAPRPRGAQVTAAEGSTALGYISFLAGAAALGGFLFGFDSAVINGAVGGLQSAFHSSSAGTGFAVAAILVGCALGALAAGPCAERFGRRLVMLATAAVFAATAVWAAVAGAAWTFTIARLLSGLGVGAASVVCPAYIAEISPARLRGRLGALQQLGIVTGIFIALLSDQMLARAAGGAGQLLWAGLAAWRWMFLVEVAPALLFAVAVLAVPESPRYLVAVRREGAALAVLRRIEPATAEAEIAAIRATVRQDRPPRLADVRGPAGGLLPIVWTGIGLAILQQLVGINSIFYYGSVLWQAVGFSAADALTINVATGLVNLVSTLVAMAFVDRVGRRPLLLWGSVGMAATLGTLAAVFATAGGGAGGRIVLPGSTGIVALLAANLFVFAFGVSWGPCVWILLGEMFPNRIRGAALALAVFAEWMANWLVTVTFPSAVASLGPAAAYGGYCLFAALSFVFVLRRVRETRGRSLEDMDAQVPWNPQRTTDKLMKMTRGEPG
jgi:SP family sugar:H+ symporter-like MFS transporter